MDLTFIDKIGHKFDDWNPKLRGIFYYIGTDI